MTNATIETPHVYEALGAILKSLSVPKNGMLPGNMGGKPYVTAVDAAAEVKRQFVENGLIFLPSEDVIKHETIIHKDRLNIVIVIKGTYTIVSQKDGSSVVVSGTGDGLATGTAVASNIASTNALKNALLRTFLITEQSAEDSAKNGVEQPERTVQSPMAQKIQNARTASHTPEQKKIMEHINSGKATRAEVNELHAKYSQQGIKGNEVNMAIVKELGL